MTQRHTSDDLLYLAQPHHIINSIPLQGTLTVPFWMEILIGRKFQIKNLPIDSKRKKLINSINHTREKRGGKKGSYTLGKKRFYYSLTKTSIFIYSQEVTGMN